METAPKTRFSVVQNAFFFSLLIGTTILFGWIVSDYIAPIFWAVIFAIVFHPHYRTWLSLVKQKSIAALLTIFAALLLVIVPLVALSPLVIAQSVNIFESVSQADIGSYAHYLDAVSAYVPIDLSEEVVRERIRDFSQSAISWVSGQAFSIGQATLGAIIQFFVMLYLLFFFVRDGEKLTAKLRGALPLGDERERFLFARFCSITRATFRGTLLIAAIQGGIGGILFFFAGVEGALVWAVVMAILSIIPAIGPALIWAPAGIILLLSGDIVGGLTILIGGGIVISSIDNFLRPVLIGREAAMPDALVLLATLGGLALFGITGFIVGPIIAGFLLAMWEIFISDYEGDLARFG